MISQLHMVKTAAHVLEKKMSMVTNNVSNAQTVGYKNKLMQMENMFPTVLGRTITEFEESNVLEGQKRRKFFEYGRGVNISEITKDMSQGTLEVTDNPTHFAVQGRGFFQVRLPDGTLGYSRAGNFHKDSEGNLVSPNNYPIEPPIRIPRGTTEMIVNEEGSVFVLVNNEVEPREVGQLLLADFSNQEGLLDIGQNTYRATASSGEAIIQTAGKDSMGVIRQHSLEYSNVDVIQSLLVMMGLQRTFDVVMKAIKASDEMLKSGTNIT